MRTMTLLAGMFSAVLAHAASVTPQEAVNALESKFGVETGMRRNHTKGMCFSGQFMASLDASRYTSSPLFNGEKVAVVGRFSHAGGNLHSEDDSAKVFGMALRLQKDNHVHNMAMLNLPYFHVSTPEDFVQRLKSASEFDATHPAAKMLGETLAKRPQNEQHYADYYYNSIHTFMLTNHAGVTLPARWVFYPNDASLEANLSNTTASGLEDNSNYATSNAKSQPKSVASMRHRNLKKGLIERLKNRPVTFEMVASFPHQTDAINDPGTQWITNGKRVTLGHLYLTEAEADCEKLNFDPLVLSAGFAASDDPVLKFRSPAYAISFAKRLGEGFSK